MLSVTFVGGGVGVITPKRPRDLQENARLRRSVLAVPRLSERPTRTLDDPLPLGEPRLGGCWPWVI